MTQVQGWNQTRQNCPSGYAWTVCDLTGWDDEYMAIDLHIKPHIFPHALLYEQSDAIIAYNSHCLWNHHCVLHLCCKNTVLCQAAQPLLPFMFSFIWYFQQLCHKDLIISFSNSCVKSNAVCMWHDPITIPIPTETVLLLALLCTVAMSISTSLPCVGHMEL